MTDRAKPVPEAALARHYRWDDGDCAGCATGTPYPCETAQMAERAQAAETVIELLCEYFIDHDSDEDSEWCLKHLPRPSTVRAVLAAHDERTKR